MEANNKRLSQIKSCLKSLLVVEKTGCTIDGLEKDYKDMVGKRLESDIRPMGFNSVEEFLHNIPDVVRRERNAWGADVFKAVADASTRHIADLVSKTPASKSKGRKGKGTLLWRGKPKQWQRSQIRSYSPPQRSRRMGSSYGMDDDDIGGYNRFNENRFFDEDDDKFSDEDMMNYKNNSAPLVTEKRSINNDVPAKTAAHCKESSSQINKTGSQNSTSRPSYQASTFTAINKDSVNPPILQGWKESSQTGPNAIISCSGVDGRQEIPAVASNVELKTSQIPPIGSYFDVAVTLAVSPQNFTVQPYLEGPKLRKLMSDLNAFYKESRNQLEAIQESQVGDYFAASNVGGVWYRMIITKIINSQKVAVKYVDFGYQSIIDKSKLRALHPQFLQLPIQAISASLAGADQRNLEAGQAWSLEDKVWFNQRVVGGHFVSLVKEVKTKPDGLVVVDLELIDTSHPSQDTYIIQQLFERFCESFPSNYY